MSELKYYKLFHRTSVLTSPEFISVVEFGNGDEVYLKSEADALLAKKDEEIDKQKWRGDEWAKACNQKDKEIESLKASHYAEMVDAGMRERRLRRALWLARAKSAENAVTNWCRECMERWNKVERKCRAKAEEFR